LVAGQLAKAALEIAERDVAGARGVAGAPLGRLANVEQQRAGTHQIVCLRRADSFARSKQLS
jgi:hypothetical protein